MIRLRKVISGGQTGADQAALIAARALGLETGGWAPQGWATEDGPAVWLKDFGLVEYRSSSYPARTRMNVHDSQVTVWFGILNTPGYTCTKNACKDVKRPFHVASRSYPDLAKRLIIQLAQEYEIINVAGNRRSKNPEVEYQVREAFDALADLVEG